MKVPLDKLWHEALVYFLSVYRARMQFSKRIVKRLAITQSFIQWGIEAIEYPELKLIGALEEIL